MLFSINLHVELDVRKGRSVPNNTHLLRQIRPLRSLPFDKSLGSEHGYTELFSFFRIILKMKLLVRALVGQIRVLHIDQSFPKDSRTRLGAIHPFRFVPVIDFRFFQDFLGSIRIELLTT